MRLLLVRHALHDWVGRGIAGRMRQVSLNGEGELQARDLAQRLAAVQLDAIYSSPQPRARETAEPLAQGRGLPIGILAEFDEIDFGHWQGLTFAELEAGHAQAWRQWVHHRSAAQLPGGETISAVRDRALAGMRRLCAEHAQQTVLVVSHGDVIKALVAHELGMPLDNLERFDIACTAVTIIEVGESGSQLKQLNAATA
jgi:broad specificity phosphatase PhoE